MSMKKVSLNGKIVRPKGAEFKKTGILIVSSRRVAVTNMISASVRYFRLDSNPEGDFPHIKDSEFNCPYQYFVENFEMLEDLANDKWVSMREV